MPHSPEALFPAVVACGLSWWLPDLLPLTHSPWWAPALRWPLDTMRGPPGPTQACASGGR